MDITKNAEEALKVLSQQTNEVVIITDKLGLITWVNDGFVELTCYSKEEAFGKKPGKLLQGKDTDPATIKKIREALNAEEPVKVDILNYTKYGRSYWLRLFIRPYYVNVVGGESGESGGKELGGFVATEVDLTKDYEMRTRLQDVTDKLARLNFEKDEIMMILSNSVTENSKAIKKYLGNIDNLVNIDWEKDERDKKINDIREVLESIRSKNDTILYNVEKLISNYRFGTGI